MRKIAIIGAIVAGLLLIGLGALWILANPNRHRDRIQAELEKHLDRGVTLGDMGLGLLPLRFTVANPVIAEDPAVASQQPFVRADNVDVQVRLLPLIRGNIVVDSVDLVRPQVELVRTSSGDWNFSSIGKSTPTAAEPETGSTAERFFALNRLTITDGLIAVTDQQEGGQRTVYDHIDLTVLDYAPGKPVSFDLAAHIQGEGAQEIRLKGEGGPVAEVPAQTPFQGELTLNEVGIDGLMQFLNSTAITQARGVLSGQSTVTNASGTLTSAGKINLANASVNTVDIGYPISIDYDVTHGVDSSLTTIKSANVQLGATPLSVSGTLNSSTTPMNMDLALKSGEVSIAEIARLAAAFGVAFAPTTSVTGKVSADVAAKGPVTKPTLTGKIAGRGLQISGQGIAQSVQVPAVDLTLTPASIQSNEFNATSGKTTVAARFALLQYASNSPSADVALKAPGATLPEIQDIARAYGMTGLDQLSGAGTLSLDMRARGPVESMTATSALRMLNGTVNLDFSPLKIAGFDTVHKLASLGGFASSLSEQDATEIVKATGNILIKNGVAQTDNLRLQLAVGNLAAAGTADLATETLNMKAAAVFTRAFSEKVSGTRAGGLLNVALTNSAGEIVLPALVTGSFREPRFAPDARAVAELQKQKFIPNLENPGQALTNVLGLLKGKPAQTQETAPGQQPAPADKPTEKPSILKGILEGLGR
jgi:uncharacterized protein involved in outer membrane biogenesis